MTSSSMLISLHPPTYLEQLDCLIALRQRLTLWLGSTTVAQSLTNFHLRRRATMSWEPVLMEFSLIHSTMHQFTKLRESLTNAKMRLIIMICHALHLHFLRRLL